MIIQQKQHLIAMKLLAITLLLLQLTFADQINCSTISPSSTKVCYVCFSNNFFNCSIKSQDNSYQQTNQTKCRNQCCSSSNENISSFQKIFCGQSRSNSSSVFVKANNSNNQSSKDNSSSVMYIVLITAIPTIFTLCCVFRCCCKRRRRNQDRNTGQQNRQSTVNLNLQGLDINTAGPYMIDPSQNCSICLESNCGIITQCNHSFHKQCLKVWITKQAKCPLCISNKINPAIQYCRRCNKSIKFIIIEGEQMEQGEVIQLCPACKQDQKQQLIQFSESGQRMDKDKLNLNQIIKIEQIQEIQQ